jgi:DNA-directed RNA polymerase specialized sigma24 family protein
MPGVKRGELFLDETNVRNRIEQLIEELNKEQKLTGNGYYAKDSASFKKELLQTDKRMMARWEKIKNDKADDNIYEDFDQYLRKLIILYDLYALELLQMLVPADQLKPEKHPLYRATRKFIHIYAYEHSQKYNLDPINLDPQDILAATWNQIFLPNLGIITYREGSKLSTWVIGIIKKLIISKYQKSKIKEEEYDDEVNIPISNVYSDPLNYACIEQEFMIKCLELLYAMTAAKSSAQKERAWIIWNDNFADYFAYLQGENVEYIKGKQPPFPPPPKNLLLGEQGAHNPVYTDYLAREIGVMRSWVLDDIDQDLNKTRTPDDKSKLRAKVRTRRYEAKLYLAKKLNYFLC